MTKKIMLIKPKLYADAVFDPIRTTQPTGLLYIGSYLKEKGYDVVLMDAVIEGIDKKELSNSSMSYEKFIEQKNQDLQKLNAEEFCDKYSPHSLEGKVSRKIVKVGLPDEAIVERIRMENPEYVGITCIASCNHDATVDLAKLIKKNFPDKRIIVGGAHATVMFEQLLKDAQGAIDFCVRGDGQFVLEELIKGKKPESGVAYLSNNELIDKGEYRRMRMSEFSLLDLELLLDINMPIPATHTYNTEDRKYIEFMASRGCNRTCDFCYAGSENLKSLKKTGERKFGHDKMGLDKVEEQLIKFKEFGYEEVILQDDDLLRDKDYFINLIGLFKKYDLRWQDNGGVAFEDLDSKVVAAIINNGNCNALYIPFNPRSDQDNQASKKVSEKHTHNLELCKKLRDAGIYTYTSAIFGTDCQSMVDLNAEIEINVSLLKKGYFDQALLFGLSYLPGARNYDKNKHDIVNPTDWIGYSIFVPHAKTLTMNIRDVEIAVIKANQEYNKVQREAGAWGSAFPKLKK